VVTDKDCKSLRVFIAEAILMVSSTMSSIISCCTGSVASSSRASVWLRTRRADSSLIRSCCLSTSVCRGSPFLRRRINAFPLRRSFSKTESG
jgi:hypothetical protein